LFSSAHAETYDALAEFSVSPGGTTGVWRYQEFDGARFTDMQFVLGGSQFTSHQPAWMAVGYELPVLFKSPNVTEGLVFHPGIPSDGPQPSRHDVALSWIAPTSGVYKIDGFVQGDSNFGGNGFEFGVFHQNETLLLLDIVFNDDRNHVV